MSTLKKGLFSANGVEVEQYIIEDVNDLKAFFKLAPTMNTLGLKDTFKKCITNKETIIVNVNCSVGGFYSWRTEGKENWYRLNKK